MVGYIIRRVLWIIPVLLRRVLPDVLAHEGDARRSVGPREAAARTARSPLLNAKYGLDDPFLVQYVRWLVGWPEEDGFQRGIILGDLGPSYRYPDRTVNDIVADGILVTIQLGVMAFALAVLVGIPLGVIAALSQNGIPDYIGHLRQRAGHLHAQLRGGHPASDRLQPRLRLVPDRRLEGAGVLGAAHRGAGPGPGGAWSRATRGPACSR